MNQYSTSNLCVKHLLIVLLSIGCISFSHAQPKTVSLSFKNAEIKTILKSIKKQVNYDFVYNAKYIDDTQRISIEVNNLDIQTALQKCFTPLGITCTIQNSIIILSKDSPPLPKVISKGTVVDSNGNPIPGVSVILSNNPSIGTSTDKQGAFSLQVPAKSTLLFSFIGMKTTMQKITEEQDMKIVLKEDTQVLGEVIAMGVKRVKRERVAGSVSVIAAQDLASQGVTSIERMIEGQVAGLNSTSISGAPGVRSQITIRGENNLSGHTEPLWILDGLPMISGVPQNNTGDYTGSIMQDGVGNVMPEDIASITILKDASAAAIYGARAANGVIVITTKSGTRSRTQVGYQGNVGVNLAPSINLDMMNNVEKLHYEQSIIKYFGINYAHQTGRGGILLKKKMEGSILEADYTKEMARLSTTNTNWFNEIFRPAFSHRHNINLQGGNKTLSYYSSLSLQNEKGVLLANKYQNAGILTKLDYRPLKNDHLIINLDLSVNSKKNNEHASAIDPFNYAVFANRYERPYDENGNYSADLSYLAENYTTQTASGYLYNKLNILRELNETSKKEDGVNAELSFRLQYKPIPRLTLSSHLRKTTSYTTTTKEVNAGTYSSWVGERFARIAYSGQKIFPSIYDNGSLSEASGKANSWVINNKAEYAFNLGEKHFFSTLAFMEVLSRKFNNFGYNSPIFYADYRITGVPSFANAKLRYDEMIGPISNIFQTSDDQSRSVSFAGSLLYSYDNKYTFTFNYRADGADVIGDQTRFTPLWSAAGRYNLHREKFFKNNFINELVIRGSYGLTGSINRSAYPFSIIEQGNNFYKGNRYVKNYQYPNPTVTWERKKERNIGVELSMWNNRVHFKADFYKNRTENILSKLKIPVSTGRDEVFANGGIVENKGTELYLNLKWIDKKDITFSTSFNYAQNQNKIVKSEHDYKSYQEAIAGKLLQGGIINIVGQETGGIYGWKTAGINPNTGNPQYYLTEEGKRAYSKFLDAWDSYSDSQKEEIKKVIPSLNEIPDRVDMIVFKNGLLPEYLKSSMQYLGRSRPKFTGGFATDFRYKNFRISTLWSFKMGHIIPTFNDFQNAPRNLYDAPGRLELGYSNDFAVSSTNRERKYLHFWQAPGDQTNVRKFSTSSNDYWASMYTSNKYQKGDYLRLNNISIDYRFSKELAEKFSLRNLSVGFNIRNLFTFTKYNGIDVTTNGAFGYPTAKQFNLNLSLSF